MIVAALQLAQLALTLWLLCKLRAARRELAELEHNIERLGGLLLEVVRRTPAQRHATVAEFADCEALIPFRPRRGGHR